MSHEVLLVTGPDDAAAGERRLRVVQRAAEAIPGAVGHRLVSMPNAAIALVDSASAGGTTASIVEEPESVLVALATNSTGLATAAEDPAKGCMVGAEAGHIAVRVTPERSVVVSTDGMASMPSYWAELDGQLLFASHLSSLVSLGLPSDLDELALAEYLTMLHPLQDRTLLRRARLLPPGGTLTWRDGATIRSAEPIFVPGDQVMTDDQAIGIYGDVWQEIIGSLFARHTDERVAIGLSGGLDSRSVAAGAAMLGRRPMTFSYGSERNTETRIAGAVAHRLGMPHAVLPVTDDHLMPAPERITAHLDGAHSPAEMYELWFADALNSFSDVVVNGAGGGPLWGDEKTIGMTDARSVAARVWARYAGAAPSAESLLSPSISMDIAHEARSGISRSLAEWDLTARSDMTVFWRVANRQVRWGNMLVNAVRRSGLSIEMPFLDARFLRFAANLSADQRINGRLHLRAQREIFKATAAIERSDDGNSPQHLNHVYWSGESPYLSQLASLSRRHPVSGARRALRRMVAVSTRELRDRTPVSAPADWWDERSSVFAIELWGRTRPPFAERLADLVDAPGQAHPAFDETALSAAVADLRSGTFTGSASALARVATANSWLADYTRRAEAYHALAP